MVNKNPKYDIVYKNLSGRNLIVYVFIGKEELVNYQLEMLANNRIDGLLKSEVLRINGETHLQFDITSLVPVQKVFERREFSRRDFLYLIKQIVELLEIMERYLLDNNGIVFSNTYIFANPQNLELEFVYLPIKDRPQSLNTLKAFLLDSIINDIKFIDEPSDNFIQRLIEILKDQEFEESSLKNYLNEMVRLNSVPIHNINTKDVLPKRENIITLSKKNEVREVTEAETVKTKKLCYPAKSYIVLFSVLGVLLLFCVALVLLGILSPSNPDTLLSLLGFFLIGGAVMYLVYSKLFTPDKKIEKVIEEKHDKSDLFTGNEYVNKTFSIPINRSNNTYSGSIAQKEAASTLFRTPLSTPQQNGLFAPENKISETRTFHTNLKSMRTQDKTEILNEVNLNSPYLKRIFGTGIETIIIKQFPFMMGRLEAQVDYCVNNPAIGKLHAEITKNNEGYFISDMNSKNGTIINGVRIEPTKENIIKNGDRITLGNEEFIFYSGSTD